MWVYGGFEWWSVGQCGVMGWWCFPHVSMYICICMCVQSVWCTLTQVEQACTCVKLNPRQQAAIQIRLTRHDISFVGDRCLLQFPLRTFPSPPFSIQITFLFGLRIFPLTYPACPQQDLFSPFIWFLILLLQSSVIRRARVRLKACFMPYWC